VIFLEQLSVCFKIFQKKVFASTGTAGWAFLSHDSIKKLSII